MTVVVVRIALLLITGVFRVALALAALFTPACP
jgi:hypothetical protein